MSVLITEKSKDYELLDSGDGQKLERYGDFVLSRPDPQAIWQRTLPEAEWKKATAIFTRVGTAGKWGLLAGGQGPESRKGVWNIQLNDLAFQLQLLPSKHVGLFPEQSAQWQWLREKVESRKLKVESEKIKVLNLFGYTGGASLACAKAGAEVCHVDSSEFAVDLAHTNMKLSGLEKTKIRFIVDDVRKFVEREIKRGNKYDVILMDPPVYGKGAKGEVWKIEEDLVPLLSRIKNILSSTPLAVVLNGYASLYSATTYGQVLEEAVRDLGGSISCGELAIKESSGEHLLPCGIFARWEK